MRLILTSLLLLFSLVNFQLINASENLPGRGVKISVPEPGIYFLTWGVYYTVVVIRPKDSYRDYANATVMTFRDELKLDPIVYYSAQAFVDEFDVIQIDAREVNTMTLPDEDLNSWSPDCFAIKGWGVKTMDDNRYSAVGSVLNIITDKKEIAIMLKYINLLSTGCL